MRMTSTVRREEKVDTVEGRRGGKESRARQRRSMVTTGRNVEHKARDKSVFESRMLVMGGYTMKEHDHSRMVVEGEERLEEEEEEEEEEEVVVRHCTRRLMCPSTSTLGPVCCLLRILHRTI